MTVVWAGKHTTVLTFESYITYTLSIDTLAPVFAVVWARDDGAVFTFKACITDTLSVEAMSSLTAVLGTGEF